MASSVEIYEVLRDHVGEHAARVVAESIPMASDLATKGDLTAGLAELRRDIVGLEAALKAQGAELTRAIAVQGAELRQAIAESRSDLLRFMLIFFVPLWLGVYGTLAAIVVGFATAS